MAIRSDIEEKSSSSSSTDGHMYDVFLSFRGIDTRNNFTNHLHHALELANFNTFLDDEKIKTGEDLKPELESAIKASRASIIVFSKNYASSSWCLDELVLILEQHRTSNQIVIPVFYHVEPTHVRKQEQGSTFGDAMAEHRQKMEAETNADKKRKLTEKINRWIIALTEVANLKGKNVDHRLEVEFIAEIVKDVGCRLQIPLSSALPLPIGMDTSIKFVTSWLKDDSSHTGDILTILGIGGIGKTTLAKYVYRSHFHKFDTSSFIEDISNKCADKDYGLLYLQKQLCGQITKTSPIQVYDGYVYTSQIENAVHRKKVFLVLDDIDSLNQLNKLLGSKGFYNGSKIIITSKNARLTKSCDLFKTGVKPKYAEHYLTVLGEAESKELLCFHAFTGKYPKGGYEEVSAKILKYCEGHPKALKDLGKDLHNQEVAYWEERIKVLEKNYNSRMITELRKGIDSLPTDNDKEMFLHIACFFAGTDRHLTETILKACGIQTVLGMRNLMDRCILSIGCDNKLVMHRLLRDTGRLIVHQESPKKPWKRSRLWCHEESFIVLKQKQGKGLIVGITLCMRMLKQQQQRMLKQGTCLSINLNTDAFSNMYNLRLLQLNYAQLNGSYENFPEELRWLSMHGFPLESIPSDLPMENLVALDLSYSKFESFKPQRAQGQHLTRSCLKNSRLLPSLKILDLSFCSRLSSLGGFDELPILERLIVTYCINLADVCESIGKCVKLEHIDLSYCTKLEKLPRTVDLLENVESILLEGCNLVNLESSLGMWILQKCSRLTIMAST